MSTSTSAASSPSPPAGAAEWEAFRTLGKRMVDEVADYYAALAAGRHAVKPSVSPGYLAAALPTSAPEAPESFDAVLADVHAHILPGVTHWQHPRFFAYFPASSSPPAILGDMLSDAINCIGFSWVASPACTELETVVLDWLRQLVGLPDCFASAGTGGGVIQSTASEATLVALLAARARAFATLKPASMSDDEFQSKLVCYTSDQAHSSVKKAVMVAGLHTSQCKTVPARAQDAYAMNVPALAAAVAEDVAAGRVPFFCVASLGTTSSGAFDPLPAVADVVAPHHMWLHVDAAWAGSAYLCPEYRGTLAGVDRVDSYDFNPHKWMRVNFDCSAMYVQQRHWLMKALSVTPEYLRSPEYDAGLVSDYRDWQVPLGRRFRALKLWFVLRMYGAAALRDYIRHHVALAERFAAHVSGDDRFEIVTPVSLGLVCFRLRGGNEVNDRLLASVNDTHVIFLVHTKLSDTTVLRFAVGSALTLASHVDEAWEMIQTHATKVLASAVSAA